MQTFHKHKILVTEQQVSDINPLWAFRQVTNPSTNLLLTISLHNKEHARLSMVSLNQKF